MLFTVNFSMFIFSILSLLSVLFGKVTANVPGLGDGGRLEIQMFNFVQRFNRRNAVELEPKASLYGNFDPLLQDSC